MVSNVRRPEDDLDADLCAEQTAQAETMTNAMQALRNLMRC